MIEKEILKLKNRRKALLQEIDKAIVEIKEIHHTLVQYEEFNPNDHGKYFDLVVFDLCKIWNINPSEIKSKSRQIDLSMKKHIIRWVAREKLHITCVLTGKLTGVDHSSVIHSCQVVDQQRQFPCIAFQRSWKPIQEYINKIHCRFPELANKEMYKLAGVNF